jgi:hypothetical protein
MKRPMSCIQEQPTEGVRPNARENGQISPIDQVFGLREVLVVGQHLASLLQEGRENANIDAGLGFIWRISVNSAFIVRSFPRATVAAESMSPQVGSRHEIRSSLSCVAVGSDIERGGNANAQSPISAGVA